jgi:hypothetical protein
MFSTINKWSVDWDYSGWLALENAAYTSQDDWNITIITRINQISANIYKASFRGGANTIRANESVVSKLIKTHTFYKTDGDLLAGRYQIEIDNSIDNSIIYVYRDLVGTENILIPIITNSELRLEHIEKISAESVMDYRQSLIGVINILNYED